METLHKLTKNEEIEKLVELLGSKKGVDRMQAREKLVDFGEESADFLIELLHHPDHDYRKEVLKTLEEIGSPDFISIYLQALEDEESDIRWIGARGLIKLGKISVKPLLEFLVEKSDSVFVLAGAHHVFYDLKKEKILPENFPVNKLLQKLKRPEWKDGIKYLAHDLLADKDQSRY